MLDFSEVIPREIILKSKLSPKKVIHLAVSYRKVRKVRIYLPLLASVGHRNPKSDITNRG